LGEFDVQPIKTSDLMVLSIRVLAETGKLDELATRYRAAGPRPSPETPA
jgi:hypothetical protein